MRTMRRRIRATSRRLNYPIPFMNPPRRRRKARRVAVARRARHHSPAMRAKISRAVKASMRRRHAGGGSASRRRTTMAVARRRSYSPARRRSFSTGGLYVIKGRKLNPGRRRRFHRRRSNPGMGLATIKGLLSKDVMVMAAGAITASVGTGYIISRYGLSLPLMTTSYGPAIYQLAIPLAGAYLIRRKSRNFAAGLVVGGVIMAITTVMKSGMLGTTASSAIAQGPMGNFYEVKGMGLAGEIGRTARSTMRPMSAYIGPKTFHTVPDAVNSPVFSTGAW